MDKSNFSEFIRTNVAEMRPYVKGEDLAEISVSSTDNPETDMGMVARNPLNHKDQWYVARKYFEDNFSTLATIVDMPSVKTLDNSTADQAKDQVRDLKVWGEPDLWLLMGKASSAEEGWMKSTKALQIDDVGCIVQVTTQQWDHVAEALVFVPGVCIAEAKGEEDANVLARTLMQIPKD